MSFPWVWATHVDHSLIIDVIREEKIPFPYLVEALIQIMLYVFDIFYIVPVLQVVLILHMLIGKVQAFKVPLANVIVIDNCVFFDPGFAHRQFRPFALSDGLFCGLKILVIQRMFDPETITGLALTPSIEAPDPEQISECSSSVKQSAL